MSFQPAVRGKVPGKIALYGVAGSGKTRSALKLARGLCGREGRIAVADTEAGTASIYANYETFDHMVVGPPFDPGKVVTIIEAAIKGKYDVLVLDSVSHFWNGPGGVLTIVDTNKSKWGAGSPAHDRMIQAILRCPIDLVLTMRAKADTIIENNVPKKIGMTYIQRSDSLEYEVGWIFYVDLASHSLMCEKQRGMPELDGAFVGPNDVTEVGAKIAAWLRGDAS